MKIVEAAPPVARIERRRAVLGFDARSLQGDTSICLAAISGLPCRLDGMLYLVRKNVVLVSCLVGLCAAVMSGAACSDSDKVPAVRETPVDIPDTSAGDDALADNLPGVLRRHLEVEFASRDWLNDVGSIESDGKTVHVALNRNFGEHRQDFDELCTAVSGFVFAADRYPATEVIVTSGDGTPVEKSQRDVPQCGPIAK